MAKKTAAEKQKTSATDGPLPPKQRDKVIKKLRKLAIPPSHPSSFTGPALTLGYEAPMPKKSRVAKSVSKTYRKKK
jgi:hypothetical protein